MAPLTAARLIHFDEKCGNGSISKGEKCTKGQGTHARGSGTNGNGTGRPGDPNYGSFKSRIARNAIPAAIAFGTIGALAGGLRGARYGRHLGGKSGAVLGGAVGATANGLVNAAGFGALGAGIGATSAATERLVTKVENKAYRKQNSKALKTGAMKAISMRKSNKEKMATVN